jgi:hypothetical protein
LVFVTDDGLLKASLKISTVGFFVLEAETQGASVYKIDFPAAVMRMAKIG